MLALVRVCPRVWLGRSVHGLCRGQCLMVVVGRENGGDPVIEQKVFGPVAPVAPFPLWMTR